MKWALVIINMAPSHVCNIWCRHVYIGVNLVFSDVDMCSFEGYLQGTSVLKCQEKSGNYARYSIL